MSGQFHVPTAFPPRQESIIYTGWVSQKTWGKFPTFVGNRTLVVQYVASHIISSIVFRTYPASDSVTTRRTTIWTVHLRIYIGSEIKYRPVLSSEGQAEAEGNIVDASERTPEEREEGRETLSSILAKWAIRMGGEWDWFCIVSYGGVEYSDSAITALFYCNNNVSLL